MDLARSVQEVTEQVMLRMARHVHAVTGQQRLCLAGGVALNGNGRLLREGPFDELWIQPAAGDAGGAVGAALAIWHQAEQQPRTANGTRDRMRGSLLGPRFSTSEIRDFLVDRQIPFQECDDHEMPIEAARLLADEHIVGWFQGRMEFGPRALGARSIIGDPRSPRMQSILNLKIKYRESFRPFAPAVLREHVSEYFELDCDSPYMLLVAQLKSEHCLEMTAEQQGLFGIDRLNVPRSTIPAVNTRGLFGTGPDGDGR